MTVPHRARTFAAIALILLCQACGGGNSSTPTVPTPSSTPPNIAGTYALTVTASSVCNQLPFSSFSFGQVNITQATNPATPSFANVTGDFPACTGCALSAGVMTATNITGLVVALPGYISPAGTFSQTVSPQRLTVAGIFAGPVPGSPITGNMNGTITIVNTSTLATASCNAADHRLTLTKQ